MMLYFCTLFDSFYLSRGLVMYESLARNTQAFHLYIFAFDDLSYEMLVSLRLKHATIISLKEFETEELLEVKEGRTKAEYCWTCTPSTIDYVLKKYKVENCTYLDADLYFYDSPAGLIQEMNNKKDVLITEHRFSKWAKIYEEGRAGRFCVQFVTFTNNPDSMDILEKWRTQCIDWCYDRYEDGKFGDQKYLDEWPEKYGSVHILKNLGGGLAPWNIQQYDMEEKDGTLWGLYSKMNQRFKFVFFHFQYVKFLANGNIDLGWHFLSKSVKQKIYIPYLTKVFEMEKKLENMNDSYKTYVTTYKSNTFREFLKNMFKKVTRYNVVKKEKIGHGICN